MSRLQVKLDHVATLRQARRAGYPDPVTAAAIVEMAGAAGVTVHLRGDRRHIQERDLEILKRTVQTRLNVMMACNQETVRLAMNLKPDLVTFLPERSDELTTEAGLDLERNRDAISKAVSLLKGSGVGVSLFIEPDVDMVKAAHKLDVDTVELNTGRYSDAKQEIDRFRFYDRIAVAARAAHKLKLVVAAGHGLTYHNARDIRYIQEIEEYNIGHAVVSRAVLLGLDRAVREMVDILK